jgi:hypothetical protein
MFGVKKNLDWPKLIKEGWIVLVNLHVGGSVRQLHSRLLGTAVLTEILDTFERMGRHGWKGRYYVYVDECAQFITEQVIHFLWHMRQAGLSMILAHQANDQFPSPEAESAVQGQTHIKLAFQQPNPDDRMATVRMMFGGDLKDREVSYALAKLRKMQAVTKVGKFDPMVLWMPILPKFPDHPTKKFMQELYSMNVYSDANEIIHEQKQRIYINPNEIHYETRQTTGDPRPPSERKNAKRKTANHSNQRDKGNIKTVFDQ